LFFKGDSDSPPDPGVWSYRPGTGQAQRRYGAPLSQITELTAVFPAASPNQGVLYFVRQGLVNDFQLWCIAPTTGNTSVGYSLYNQPRQLTQVDGTLFFLLGSQLMRISDDGSSFLTITESSVGQISFPTDRNWELISFENRLFFSAEGPTSIGAELWTLNAAQTRALLVGNVDPSRGGNSYPANLTVHGSSLYFTADNGTQGVELWKTDGQGIDGLANRTQLVSDLYAGASGSQPDHLISVGDRLVFSASDAAGTKLWKNELASAAPGAPQTDLLRRVDQDPGLEVKVSVVTAEADLIITAGDLTAPAADGHQFTLPKRTAADGIVEDEGLDAILTQALSDALKSGSTRVTVRLELPVRSDGFLQDNIRFQVDTSLKQARLEYGVPAPGNDADFADDTRLVVTPASNSSVAVDIYDQRGGLLAQRVTQSWRRQPVKPGRGSKIRIATRSAGATATTCCWATAISTP
jgi:ELWxxDGT repeat protein